MSSHIYSPKDSSRDNMKHILSTAHAALDQVYSAPLCSSPPLSHSLQPPPPSLREILAAYRTKGDGDRDMLLAMLNAKTAEDEVGAIIHPSSFAES